MQQGEERGEPVGMDSFLDIHASHCYIFFRLDTKEGTMYRSVAFVIAVMFFVVSVAVAGEVYQVTGPVLEVKDNSITVQKGNEKWQIARDKDTKVTRDVKIGSKVTVKYQMKATTIEVKDEGKKEKKK